MSNSRIDFEKVEALRFKMQLSAKHMAHLFGVSRAAYYKWLGGGSLRQAREEKVRETLRRLLKIALEHDWPSGNVLAMTSDQRLAHLKVLLEAEQ